MLYKLENIHMKGNEHGQLRANTVYAELRDENGGLVISATLEYILCSIRDKKLNTEGVSVEWSEKRGTRCSTVSLL